MAVTHSLAFLIALLVVYISTVCAQQECQRSGELPSVTSDHTCPPGQDPSTELNCCNPSSATCCEPGKVYDQYSCSPPVTSTTPAIMTLNDFSEGGDGGGLPSCSSSPGGYYPSTERVVALSSGWYNGGSLCLKNINITANGITVMAMVVDECDSKMGCDEDHNFQVPCRNNVVDASQAVWDALGISSDAGETNITWTPA